MSRLRRKDNSNNSVRICFCFLGIRLLPHWRIRPSQWWYSIAACGYRMVTAPAAGVVFGANNIRALSFIWGFFISYSKNIHHILNAGGNMVVVLCGISRALFWFVVQDVSYLNLWWRWAARLQAALELWNPAPPAPWTKIRFVDSFECVGGFIHLSSFYLRSFTQSQSNSFYRKKLLLYPCRLPIIFHSNMGR